MYVASNEVLASFGHNWSDTTIMKGPKNFQRTHRIYLHFFRELRLQMHAPTTTVTLHMVGVRGQRQWRAIFSRKKKIIKAPKEKAREQMCPRNQNKTFWHIIPNPSNAICAKLMHPCHKDARKMMVRWFEENTAWEWHSVDSPSCSLQVERPRAGAT